LCWSPRPAAGPPPRASSPSSAASASRSSRSTAARRRSSRRSSQSSSRPGCSPATAAGWTASPSRHPRATSPRRAGQPNVKIPERFDGAQLIVQVPAIVVQEYAGGDGAPRLLVGKAGTIGLDADGGASLEDLRELALRLPGLPEQTAAELRDISDWRITLPPSVTTTQARWRPATVDGAKALSFADPTGKLHALLWQRGGHIWGVAGVISSGEA